MAFAFTGSILENLASAKPANFATALKPAQIADNDRLCNPPS